MAYRQNSLVHAVIRPSPYADVAFTKCGIRFYWRLVPVCDDAPTCFGCLQQDVKNP